ncbi:alpha-L-arabinofuranosidase C-terminal domain-containing protein [Streptomyces sp. NPDC020125]|uniref:alpha-L-arabinofuranosidase C-terminal domain-containing protein n=1 Tax=Streptomyces sp. NPDC020125 TaxID=3154593 RepID=UPI0033E84885
MSTPEAVVREQLSDFFHGGGQVVDSEVKDNAEVSTRETPLGSSYEALVTNATVDKDGNLNLVVVNRSPDDDIKSRVEPGSFQHATTVDVSLVAGRTYHDFNNAEHPEAVTIQKSRATAHDASLTWTFPAHSVTLLRFPPEKTGATSSDEKRTSHA